MMVMVGSCLMLPAVSGCVGFPCGTSFSDFLVKGVALDSETLDPAMDVGVSGILVTEEDRIRPVIPVTSGGFGPFDLPPLEEDGSFQIVFRKLGGFCTFLGQRAVPPPEFSMPQQVVLILATDDCEQRITIDINEGTVVDMTFPDDTIELKDPILVSACGVNQ